MAEDNSNAKLDRARFHLAEHHRQDYVAIIPQGMQPQDLENASYWSVVSNICRPFGRIEARAEDGSWIAELVITEVGRQFVRVKILQLYTLSAVEPAGEETGDQNYEVLWRGQHHKFCVKRLADNEIVHTGEATKDGARGWLREHLKALRH